MSDERLENLEARVDAIERRLGIQPFASVAAEPAASSSHDGASAGSIAASDLSSPVIANVEPATPATPAAPAAPAAEIPSAAPPRRRPTPAPWTQVLADLERQLTGRALAAVGGAALVAGAIFFLSLAFSRGWIGPEGRVLIGIAASGVTLALGSWLLDHRQPIVGQVLVGVGLAVISLSAFAATRLYHLAPVELALLATLVAAVAAACLAVRHDAQIIAVLALVALLAAPPVLGASPSLITIAYLGSVLVGFAALSLVRTWRWLPGIAFVLSAPQLASWLADERPSAVGLTAAVVFWVLNVATAGGEEYLRPRNRLRAGSATLIVANAAFLVWAGFTVLDESSTIFRGPFLVAVALAHVVLAGVFLLRDGDHHPFGLLAAGTGVAALAMAAPVQFGGSPVPIAWAAEAAALAWIAGRRQHEPAALAAAVLGTLAAAHVAVFEYPVVPYLVGAERTWPFANANGLTLAFVLAAAAAGAWFLRARPIVATIAAVGLLLAADGVAHELDGPALIGGWALLGLVGVAIDSFVVRAAPARQPVGRRLPAELAYGVIAAAGIVAFQTATYVLLLDLRVDAMGPVRSPDVPFLNDRGATTAILAAGVAVAGWIHLRRVSLELPAVVALVAAGLILGYGSLFQVGLDAAIVIAAGLASLAFLLGSARGVARDGWLVATATAGAVIGGATLAVLTSIAPPSRLTLDDLAVIDGAPFVSAASSTLGALAVALAIGMRRNGHERFAPWLGLASGVLVVYLLSIGVVELFQVRIRGPIAFEELATQAQVALSVLWVVLGTAGFVIGLVRRRVVVRQAGLGLLVIASAKVFLFDLASLDVAYRVLSLVALGTFLLIAAWVYNRLTDGAGGSEALPSADSSVDIAAGTTAEPEAPAMR